MQLSITQARFDKFDVLTRSSDALFRFLLKSVQNVHDAGKTHGVNGPVGVAVEIVDQFENRTTAESLQRLGSYWLVPFLPWFKA
jgi:hypothetical protein